MKKKKPIAKARKRLSLNFGPISMNIRLCTRVFKNGQKRKIAFHTKSSMRPISILLYAYQPEHYKIETGSVRGQVMVGFGGKTT